MGLELSEVPFRPPEPAPVKEIASRCGWCGHYYPPEALAFDLRTGGMCEGCIVERRKRYQWNRQCRERKKNREKKK